jgi:hypothetical protein
LINVLRGFRHVSDSLENRYLSLRITGLVIPDDL